VGCANSRRGAAAGGQWGLGTKPSAAGGKGFWVRILSARQFFNKNNAFLCIFRHFCFKAYSNNRWKQI